MLRRRKEHLKGLMKEENERERRMEEVENVEQKNRKISKDEAIEDLKRMNNREAVGRVDTLVNVEFLTFVCFKLTCHA